MIKIGSFYDKYKSFVNITTFAVMVLSACISIGLYVSMGVETRNDVKELRVDLNSHIVTDQVRFEDLKHGGTDVAIRTEAKVDLLLMIYGIDADKINDFSILVKKFKRNPREAPKADTSFIREKKEEIEKKVKENPPVGGKNPVSPMDLIYNIQYVPDRSSVFSMIQN